MIISIPILLLAILFLFLGYRGRRIDAHPLCKHCRYDLFNKPESSTRCPECGCDISYPSAVRIGHRARRTWALTLGYFLAIPAALFLGTSLTLSLTHFDYYPYEPLTILRWQFASKDPDTSARALAEISRRLPTLSPADVSPLIDQILTWQADTAHPWDNTWGDFIFDANAAKLLSPAHWERFFQQAACASFRVRSTIRAEEPFMVWTSAGLTRCASSSHLSPFTTRIGIPTTFTLGPATLSNPGAILGGGGGLSYGLPFKPEPAHWQSLGTGPREISVKYALEIRIASFTPVTTHRQTTLNITIVPPNTPLIKLIHDPKIHEAMTNSFEIISSPGINTPNKIQIPCPSAKPPTPGTPFTDDSIDIRSQNAPAPGLFHAELVQGSIRWPYLGTVRSQTGLNNTGFCFSLDRSRTPTTLPSPGPAEIVLTPDPQTAYESPDELSEIYADPLHIPVELLPEK